MAWQTWWERNDWAQHTDSWGEENPHVSQQHWSAWDDAKEKPQQDRFRNVTTLGCFGKHTLTLEDRKDLLLGVVNELVPSNNLSQMSVACWGADTTMAAFWLLTNCGPSTSIRWLKDPQDKYCFSAAVGIMAKAAQSFYVREPSKMEEMVDFIVECSWKQQDRIVAKAIERGFDPSEALDPSVKKPRTVSEVVHPQGRTH